jgi:hypothetical protein
MPYAPVSVNFDTHPKVAQLGRNIAPLGLWIVALTYSSRHLQDGYVPHWLPRKVAGRFGLRWAKALVKVGLWEVCEGGWMIHDFLDWQKSRQQIEHIRHVRQQAGSLGGRSKRQANAKQDAKHLLDDAEANFKMCLSHYHYTPTTHNSSTKNLGEREKTVVGGKTLRGGGTLTDAGAPPTGTEGRPPRLVTPNVAELFLSLRASESSEDEQHTKTAKLAEYQAYLERNGLTPRQESC